MKTFVVLAHHEPSSFNAAMVNLCLSTLQEQGHEVKLSDLYAMNFDPVSDRRNFMQTANPDRLDQQAEERFASDGKGFEKLLQLEIDKLLWSDLVIFQFPIWWLGMPAIMKGWIDRVFAVGVAYGGGRWFDRGVLSGKRVMLSITMGGPEAAYSDRGIYGPIENILHPMHQGIFGFVGFDVIEPFIVYGPGRMGEQERAAALDSYRSRLLSINSAPILPKIKSDDYVNFIRKE
jgi:NAD(P)H dehydrogenase (quinone)